MSFKLILKRLAKSRFEVSVLIPIREDKKIHKLLDKLSKQTYKNFIILIANDSKEPYLKDSDFPKNLSYAYYYAKEQKYSTFDKLNFLADRVKTPFAAITESDCEPHENWLYDLVPIVKKEKTVIKGCEARPVGCCTANLIFPSEILKKIKFDTNVPIVADYEWGMNLEKRGHPIRFYSDKGVVFHNLITGKPRLNRIIPCARDEVAIAFKYKDPRFLFNKIMRNGYNILVSLSQMFLIIFYYVPYFFVKSLKEK